MSRAPTVKNAPPRHESSYILHVSDMILFKFDGNDEPRLGFITNIHKGETDFFLNELLIKVDNPMHDLEFNKDVLVKKVGNIKVARELDGSAGGTVTDCYTDVWDDFRPLSECDLVDGEVESWYWVTRSSSLNINDTRQIDPFISAHVQNQRGRINGDAIPVIELLSSSSLSVDESIIDIFDDGMYQTIFCLYESTVIVSFLFISVTITKHLHLLFM